MTKWAVRPVNEDEWYFLAAQLLLPREQRTCAHCDGTKKVKAIRFAQKNEPMSEEEVTCPACHGKGVGGSQPCTKQDLKIWLEITSRCVRS